MATQKIETILEKSNYDTKKILNRSEKVISEKELSIIENEGATYELLESMNVPFYKYGTQITIHGMFPKLKNERVGYYKNLCQNKNKSIGCKYTALDREKKRAMFSTVKAFDNSFFVVDNSTSYLLRKSKRITSQEELNKNMPAYKEIYNRIDNNLFIGRMSVYVAQDLFWSYLIFDLNISLIKKENMDILVEQICNAKIDDIKKYVFDKNEQERVERERKETKEKKEKEERKAKAKPILEAAFEEVKTQGYTFQTVNYYDGLIYLSEIFFDEEEEKAIYKFIKLSKTKQQKKFRFFVAKTDNINGILEFKNPYCGGNNQTDRTKGNVYIKN